MALRCEPHTGLCRNPESAYGMTAFTTFLNGQVQTWKTNSFCSWRRRSLRARVSNSSFSICLA